MAQPTDVMASPLIEVYQQMEDDLLRNIAKRLSLSGDLTFTGTWQMNKLQELGMLNKENLETIAKYAETADRTAQEALEQLSMYSVKQKETQYTWALKNGANLKQPIPVGTSPAVKRLLRQSFTDLKGQLSLVRTTALENANKSFVNIINQAYLEASSGLSTLDSSIRKGVQRLADEGITGATYRSANGKVTRNHLETVVRRSVFTASSQAGQAMQMERAKDWGNDLVEVDSHAGSRPDHAKWQGQIFSLSGNHPKYPSFHRVTKYGTAEGLGGINCRHDFYPFFEGLSSQTFKPYPKEENDKEYKESQKQRSLERNIRAQKRKLIASEAQGDPEGMLLNHQKLQKRQADLRGFLDETGRPRRNELEQVYGYKPGVVGRAKQLPPATPPPPVQPTPPPPPPPPTAPPKPIKPPAKPKPPKPPKPIPAPKANKPPKPIQAPTPPPKPKAKPLKSDNYPEPLRSHKAHAKELDKFTDFINKNGKADPRMVEIYSKIGEMDNLSSKPGVKFTQSYAQGHSLGWKARLMGGKLDVREVKITVPKMNDTYPLGTAHTIAHEQMHLIDLFANESTEGSFAKTHTKLKEAFKTADMSMGQEATDLFATWKKDVDIFQVEIKAERRKAIEDLKLAMNGSLQPNYKDLAQYKKTKTAVNKLAKEYDDLIDAGTRAQGGGGVTALQDIYDAISHGHHRDKGNVTYGHGSRYYTGGKSSPSEAVANWGSINLLNPELADILRRDKPAVAEALDAFMDDVLTKVGGP